jgi:hypothetical protein
MNIVGRSRSNRHVLLSWDLRVELERNTIGKFQCCRSISLCLTVFLYLATSPESGWSLPTWIPLSEVDPMAKVSLSWELSGDLASGYLLVSLDVACGSIWLCSTVFLTLFISPEYRSSIPRWPTLWSRSNGKGSMLQELCSECYRNTVCTLQCCWSISQWSIVYLTLSVSAELRPSAPRWIVLIEVGVTETFRCCEKYVLNLSK